MRLLLFIGILMLAGCSRNNEQSQSNMLAEADARRIALEKAGVENAIFTKQEYDSEDSDFEFEFHTTDLNYECEISARDGKIKDYSVEERYDTEELNHLLD